MCGINGYYSFSETPPTDDFHRATQSMFHRGPDAGGFFLGGHIGLGHRRLSIIDTNEEANQPFYSNDNNYIIVFNGEIYNYKELARDYFINSRTSSDTEVLLEVFAKLGNACFKILNGMFAFAIFNKQKNKLILCRDRMGIKPLYYFYNEKIFIFSSEIKALLKYKLIYENNNFYCDSIVEYLNLGYIPEPNTFYTSIKQLKAGHFVEIDAKGINEIQYWDTDQNISKTILTDEKQAFAELSNLLKSSVEYRLNSDVPFGAFLSGGVDSSMITAIASQLYPKKLKTFSIGFSESTHDESPYAEAVSQYLGTDHHTFKVTDKDALELVDEAISLYDQPFADSSSIPTLLVSRLASKEVKMVLTGDGGDELFMGYGSYDWANRFHNPLIYSLRMPLSAALKSGPSRYKRISGLLRYDDRDDLKRHIFSQEQYLFTNSEIHNLLIPEINRSSTKMNFNYTGERALSPAEQQALFDLNYYLRDDLLVKVDRASMAASLECRLPLLDYRIVEWSLNLDPRLKKKRMQSKYLLKQILYSYLPEQLFNRPKWGFAVPLSKWLQGPLYYLQEEYLSESKIKETGLLDPDAVKGIVTKFRSGKYDYFYNRLWTLIILQKMIIKKPM